MRKSYLASILFASFILITGLQADVSTGASLFQGTKHFKNGAVSCIACHSVNSNLVKSGGKLAINLTSMGGMGIKYTILKPENASSPIMREAFKGKPLTASEQSDLIDFFNKVAKDNAKTSNGYTQFIIGGIIGAIIIFLFLSLLGRNRKKLSVNQRLFDRQLKTSWKEPVR